MALIKYSLIISLAVVMLAGCATSGVGTSKTSKSINSGSSLSKVSPATKRSYAAGLKAMRSGDLKVARKTMLAITKQHPNLSGPHANLGIIYYEQGKAKKAEAAFKHALRLNSKRPEVHNRLGILYRSQGRFRDARVSYEIALKRDKNYTNAHLNLGILYDLYLGKPNKALHHYQLYQSAQKKKDRAVKKWIIDIKRRVKPVTRSARASR